MANSTILYAGTKKGLVIFNKPGTLPDWLPSRFVLQGRPVRTIWAEPGPPIRVLASVGVDEMLGESASDEVVLSENGGRAWASVFDAPVASMLGVNGGDNTTLYAGMVGGGIAGSMDGGRTWGIMPGIESAGSIRAMLADQKEQDRFYVLMDLESGHPALLAGNPETGAWHSLALEGARSVAQDAVIGDLYAVTAGGVQMSVNRGTNWDLLPGSPSEGIHIVVIPGPQDAPVALLVGTEVGLAASHDGGVRWQDVLLPQPGGIAYIARDPERRDRLYIATSSGYLFESGNRGESWQSINTTPLGQVNYLYVIRI